MLKACLDTNVWLSGLLYSGVPREIAQGILSLVKEKQADNLILETAWLGEAQYLVTGDKKHLLPLNGHFHKINIITPATFLSVLKENI